MSLGALDFGLIVDGAVIIVEAVMHSLSSYQLSGNGKPSATDKSTNDDRMPVIESLTQSQMDTQVNNSASKMMNSAVFGTNHYFDCISANFHVTRN